MNDFVFIIPLTPKRLLNPIRQTLFDLMIYGLKNQKSNNWNALLMGEEEKVDGNLIFLNSEKVLDQDYVKEFRGDPGHTDKHHKIEIALQHIARESKKPKYLIRLDDDDLISPDVIQFIEREGMNYDCYADKYQALYNITDAQIALPDLPWLANSVFHKYEHAITVVPQFNRKLINCSHSDAFHLYYKDKKIYFFPKYEPLYLRILSETSLHIKTAETTTYGHHKRKYGFWFHYQLPSYEAYIQLLIEKFQVILNSRIERKGGRLNLVLAKFDFELKRQLSKITRRLGSKP